MDLHSSGILPWIKRSCQSGAAAVQIPCQCSPTELAEGKGRWSTGRTGHQEWHLRGHSREKLFVCREKKEPGREGWGGGSKFSLQWDSKAVSQWAAVHRHHKYTLGAKDELQGPGRARPQAPPCLCRCWGCCEAGGAFTTFLKEVSKSKSVSAGSCTKEVLSLGKGAQVKQL